MAGMSHSPLMGHPLLGEMMVGTSPVREIGGWDIPVIIDGTSLLREINS